MGTESSANDGSGVDGPGADDSATNVARKPAKSQDWALAVGRRRSSALFFGFVRTFIRTVLYRWLRLQARGREHLAIEGPVIVAPVHRSNLDAPLVAALGKRTTRALAKESLFVNPIGAWVCAALGAIPIRRGEADREAMRSARTLLEAGEMMFVFPEGTRQTGRSVTGVFDGMSYLASKTGAPIIPVGIAGTDEALPPGAKFLRRARVAIIVGEPIPAPVGRMSRPALTKFSADVGVQLQAVFDEAHALIDP